jgi:hypothetical protein
VSRVRLCHSSQRASSDTYVPVIHIRHDLCAHEALYIIKRLIPRFALSPTTSPQHEPALTLCPMSQTSPTTASSSSLNFQSIFNAALEDYQKKTKNDLLKHRLTTQLEHCQSASAILDVLYKQPHVQQFIQSRTDGGSSKQWLSATATVLCSFSAAIGQGVGMVVSKRSSRQLSAI